MKSSLVSRYSQRMVMKMSALFTKGDVLVLVGIMPLVLYLFLTYWHFNNGVSDTVQIVKPGKTIEYSLWQNKIVHVVGDVGETIVEIESGRVRVTASSCKRQLCVHQGWVSISGDIVACVPNKVSVVIAGDISGFDTINF